MTMIIKARNFIKRLKSDQSGLTAVEYAVLGGVVVAAIAALQTDFSDALSGAFTSLFEQIN